MTGGEPPGPEAAAAPGWGTGAARVWLPTAEEMAALDRAATASGATTERALIEAAGREIAREVRGRWPEGPVMGLVGSGHNGADTLVALRTLRAWGREVRAIRCGSGPPEPEVRAGWDLPLEEPEAGLGGARGATVLLDGILGTGVSGAPRERQAGIIRSANRLAVPIVAVDGPSGANLSTGRVPGDCVRARLTLTLGWPKLGLLLFPARSRCGEIAALEIGFPPPEGSLAAAGGSGIGARAITGRWVRKMLRPRSADAHKGEAGYLTLMAGSEGMAGACVLAARAALRAGAGIVRVVGDPANRAIVQTAVPEAIFVSWDSAAGLREAVEWADAVAVGPGLGADRASRSRVEAALEAKGDRPVLLDADGLNVWAGEAGELAGRAGPGGLLTPHPGEMARLLNISVSEVLEDPIGLARRTAERLGVTLVLKGSPTVVAPPTGPARVATTGGAAVATGGSGDVLSGAAGALLAAGLAPPDAAAAALFLCGVAADRAAIPEGHLPSDVPRRLPEVRAELARAPRGGTGPILFRLPAAPVTSPA